MADFLYGINPVYEALQGKGRDPLGLYVVKNDKNQRLQQLIDLARSMSLKVSFLPPDDLDRMAGHSHHQGILLKIKPFQYVDLSNLLELWHRSGRDAFLLLLDGITDPHNFGAILRSAEVAGCQGVIVAKDRSCPVTPVVENCCRCLVTHTTLSGY